MEVTLDYLMKGLAYSNNGVAFLSPKEYVTPFVNEMKLLTNKFIVKVEQAPQSIILNGEPQLVFEKVWIQAIVGDVTYNMIYALDIRTPMYKFFKGYGRPQLITDANSLISGTIESGMPIPDDFKKLLTIKVDTTPWINRLKMSPVKEKTKLLGQLVEKALVTIISNGPTKYQLSTSDVISAYKAVYFDGQSEYGDSLYGLYQTITKAICNGKDYFSVPEKILLTNLLFKQY